MRGLGLFATVKGKYKSSRNSLMTLILPSQSIQKFIFENL
jgi:hypothetical protein